MKTKEDRDFEALFRDANLQPSRKFDRQLRAKLHMRNPRPKSVIIRVVATATAMALVALVGVAVFRPGAPHGQQANNKPGAIVAKALYAEALAAQTPTEIGQKVTFWRIDRQIEEGPQANACSGIDAIPPETLARLNQLTTTAIYNDGKVSALVQSAGGQVQFQRYSGDGAISAADIKNFDSSNSIPILSNETKITDKQGNPLADNSKVSGGNNYDMYLKTVAGPGSKEAPSGCPTLMMHLVIDAETKVATSVETYKDTIDTQNLVSRTSQKVSTQKTTYDQIKPLFVSLGFSQDQADLAKTHDDYLQETNVDVGYLFSYVKSIYGEARLQKITDKAGNVTAYRYTFTAQPNVVLILRTDQAPVDGFPRTADELNKLAAANKWETNPESGPRTTPYPTLGPIATNGAFVVGGGKVRIVMEYGAPSHIRSVYIEQNQDTVPYIPRPAGTPEMVPYTPPKNLIGPFMPFQAGGTPPGMH